MKLFLFLFLCALAIAQTPTLEEFSQKLNSELPENFDHLTRLRKTTVENDHLIFHFLVLVNKEEFASAHPKVKQQVLSRICRDPREGRVLRQLRKPLVYRYENEKGQSLGEFVVTPEHCQK